MHTHDARALNEDSDTPQSQASDASSDGSAQRRSGRLANRKVTILSQPTATARILTPVREADEESDDDNQQSKPKDWLPINTRVEVRDAQREENGYVGTIVGRGTSNITGLTWYRVKLDHEHPRGGTTGVYQGSQLRQANTCVLYAHALCRCF